MLTLASAPVKKVHIPRLDGHSLGFCLAEFYSRAAAEKVYNHYKDGIYTVEWDIGPRPGREYQKFQKPPKKAVPRLDIKTGVPLIAKDQENSNRNSVASMEEQKQKRTSQAFMVTSKVEVRKPTKNSARAPAKQGEIP